MELRTKYGYKQNYNKFFYNEIIGKYNHNSYMAAEYWGNEGYGPDECVYPMRQKWSDYCDFSLVKGFVKSGEIFIAPKYIDFYEPSDYFRNERVCYDYAGHFENDENFITYLGKEKGYSWDYEYHFSVYKFFYNNSIIYLDLKGMMYLKLLNSGLLQPLKPFNPIKGFC